jgi:hypothetical protein
MSPSESTMEPSVKSSVASRKGKSRDLLRRQEEWGKLKPNRNDDF